MSTLNFVPTVPQRTSTSSMDWLLCTAFFLRFVGGSAAPSIFLLRSLVAPCSAVRRRRELPDDAAYRKLLALDRHIDGIPFYAASDWALLGELIRY